MKVDGGSARQSKYRVSQLVVSLLEAGGINVKQLIGTLCINHTVIKTVALELPDGKTADGNCKKNVQS